MSEHVEHPSAAGGTEVRDVSRFKPLVPVLLIVGIVALAAAVGVAFIGEDDHRVKRLGLAYLTGFSAFLTVSVGALFFVIIQHLTRAGWSVTVRRLAECMAMNVWLMAILFLPVALFVPQLYAWADPHHAGDPLIASKAAWLNRGFWTARQFLVWFAAWGLMALWFWRNSVRQDRTGEVEITDKLQRTAGLMAVIFALATNFGYFDMLMTLDPHWYSTMFGVYAFAGSFLNFFAVSILIFRFLQSRGVVTRSVTVEHYHDLGKFMFAFVFFWSYVAFSQWMLIWYGNIPEETAWLAKRGGTTDDVWAPGIWGIVALVLMFGHWLIPFAGLLSRWTKRILPLLTFWAGWIVVAHFVDMFWIIMPETHPTLEHTAAAPHFGKSLALAAICWAGVGSLWLAGLIWFAAKASLVPARDPRMPEALNYEVY